MYNYIHFDDKYEISVTYQSEGAVTRRELAKQQQISDGKFGVTFYSQFPGVNMSTANLYHILMYMLVHVNQQMLF